MVCDMYVSADVHWGVHLSNWLNQTCQDNRRTYLPTMSVLSLVRMYTLIIQVQKLQNSKPWIDSVVFPMIIFSLEEITCILKFRIVVVLLCHGSAYYLKHQPLHLHLWQYKAKIQKGALIKCHYVLELPCITVSPFSEAEPLLHPWLN